MKNSDRPVNAQHNRFGITDKGLTKREYFAGLAMQGLLAGIPAGGIISYDEVADDARRCADALLNQLQATEDGE